MKGGQAVRFGLVLVLSGVFSDIEMGLSCHSSAQSSRPAEAKLQHLKLWLVTKFPRIDLSAYATTSMEEVITASGKNPYFMQPKLFRNKEITRSKYVPKTRPMHSAQVEYIVTCAKKHRATAASFSLLMPRRWLFLESILDSRTPRLCWGSWPLLVLWLRLDMML
jgi:hypothetical protein